MNEFEIIEKFFQNKTFFRKDVATGIGDDAAIVEVPANHRLAITTDTLIANVHFPANTAAFDIGFKALAVNLSDLAAMGATPSWFTLAITLPNADTHWLTEFCRGLYTLAAQFNLQLIGGDTTHGETLSVTIAAYGFLPQHATLTRSGAKVGDLIYVSNTLGDAALGLQLSSNKETPSSDREYLLKRLNLPEPRIELGKQLLTLAHAAIDISDGLAADLQHILKMSNVGATLCVDQLPLSQSLKNIVTTEEAIALALNGGDDYELCFTIDKKNISHLPNTCTCIGVITDKKELDLRFTDGREYINKTSGYQHFT